MLKMIGFLVFLYPFTFASVGQADTYRGFRTYSLFCESNDFKHEICDFRKGVAGVKLYDRVSGAACDLNASWGYSSRYLWVSKGCSAVFRVFEDVSGDDYNHILCSSRQYQVGKCISPVNVDYDSVELVIQLSHSRCQKGVSWGVDQDEWSGRDYFWVTEGCQGLFVYQENQDMPSPVVDQVEPETPEEGQGTWEDFGEDEVIVIDLQK